MPTRTPRMNCPECNVELNFNAEKLHTPTSPAEQKKADPVLAGIVTEAHCCPECGTPQHRDSVP